MHLRQVFLAALPDRVRVLQLFGCTHLPFDPFKISHFPMSNCLSYVDCEGVDVWLGIIPEPLQGRVVELYLSFFNLLNKLFDKSCLLHFVSFESGVLLVLL